MQLKTNHWLAIGVVALSVLWLLSGFVFQFGGDEAEQTAAPAPLRVIVEPLDYRQTPGGVFVSGRTEANHATIAEARANGIVLSLPVAEGETVQRGQVVARLSDEARTETVREAEARVAQARAAYDASAELAEDGFFPRLTLDQRRAELAAAEASLDRARAEAARGQVTAPVAGVLDQLIVEPGEAVSPGTEVARIVDLDPIVATASLSDAERPNARIGDTAQVTLQDGRDVAGRVRFVAASADAATATYRIEIEIPNPDGDILAGQIAEIRLAGTGVRAAQVARSAITLNEQGVIGVKYVDSGDRVAFAEITVVEDDPAGLWISGPPDGARVIVRGQEYALSGATVEPVRAGSQGMGGQTPVSASGQP